MCKIRGDPQNLIDLIKSIGCSITLVAEILPTAGKIY